MSSKKNELIGKTVTKVWLAEDRQAIKFDVADGEPIVALVDADCCSYTWIESIDLPDALLGTVMSVEDLDLPGDYKADASMFHSDPDVLSYYGCKITTTNGIAVIDYRNDSNGYYGGNLVWPGERGFYGGVYGQNISKQVWQEVSK